MLRKWVMGATCLALLCSCGEGRDRVLFDGAEFQASVKKVTKDHHGFEVTVRRASQSTQGAIEAAEYAATRYCVLTFGSSEIAWADGAILDPASLETPLDVLNLAGRCLG
jgi:hypothetical protein